MRYSESVQFLYSLGNELKSVKFGLEAITLVLQELGNPQQRFRSVHVAGTNGKGSTSAMIESGLRQAGSRTALYTSPHLVEPTERIQIDGKPVTRAEFAEAFSTVHAAAEQLVERGALEHHPTYFETVTAMAFVLFSEAGVEWAVIETGMGGRLDATNVLLPELCVITPVDFDHEAFLGNSLQLIAAEKAGILKPGVPCVLGAQRPEALEVLQRRAAELGCELTEAVRCGSIRGVDMDAYGSSFDVRWERGTVRVRCPLAGEHQIENAATAAAALRLLGVPAADAVDGIASTRWPGRLERVRERPEVVLDGAHNPAGARALAAHIERFYSACRVHLVYGAMRDKSVAEITEILFPLAAEVTLVASAQPRAVRPEALLPSIDHPNVHVASSTAELLPWLDALPSSDVVFITGSLYLVGEMRGLLVE